MGPAKSNRAQSLMTSRQPVTGEVRPRGDARCTPFLLWDEEKLRAPGSEFSDPSHKQRAPGSEFSDPFHTQCAPGSELSGPSHSSVPREVNLVTQLHPIRTRLIKQTWLLRLVTERAEPYWKSPLTQQ